MSAKEGKTMDNQVVKELKSLYKDRIHPIEDQFLFRKFNHPPLLDSELNSKPTVLLVGQYSTGKTTFIQNLIEMDYPDMHIGPEPTTDKFVAVVYGEESKVIMGNATTGIDILPFSGLSTFGSNFLKKFEAAVVPAPLLKDLIIVDTPGVLSGEKQRAPRGYDFSQVCKWFAARSDMIILMFDCSKLDISDEFKDVIEQLQPYEDKVYCVLNKADQLDTEALMRVYGALLWSIGRVFKGAEVTRVFVGSFKEGPLLTDQHTALFKRDHDSLIDHLKGLPSSCSMRKINEIVKRIRLIVVHICILGYLKSRMPFFFGKEKIRRQLIDKLGEVFIEVQRMYQLSDGDFPSVVEYQQFLSKIDFSEFRNVDFKILSELQDILTNDIPRITRLVSGVYDDQEEERVAEVDTLQPKLFAQIGDALSHEGNFGLSKEGWLTLAFAFMAILFGFIFAASDDRFHFMDILREVFFMK